MEECNGNGKNEKQTRKNRNSHRREKKMYDGKMVRASEHIIEHKQNSFAIIE